MLKIAYKSRSNKILNIDPTRLIVFSFMALILTGALLLSLPAASRSGGSIGFLNALFTATSASCVTGLAVVDTYNHWTLFGQLVILFCIQIGGLGIITLATFFSSILGRRVGLKGMLLAQESVNDFSFQGVLKLIRNVVVLTLIIEFTGAIILSLSFVPRFGPAGLYIALFHSVSAFCNAGFDLMGIMGLGDFKSLTEFNNDPLVIYTIPALIIIGGLGFIVWKNLYEYRKTHSLFLHTKLVLVITACLLFFSAIFFFVFESGNPATMGKLDLYGKLNASVFQAVTPRTAGFNTLPLDDMTEISKVMTIILMFIGAAPGSTGGGIKVTTFGVLLFAIISQIKGTDDTIIFKRRVSASIVAKALAITGLSAILVITVATIILAIEGKPFINVLYEVTSAFGTVGLSTGITPDLHNISKILIIMMMFLGRVGPLTFAIALALRNSKRSDDVVIPEGKIVVG